MGGPGKGICGTLLFAPWVVWQILNMSWFMFQIQSTHPQQKKNLPSRPSTAVLQRARLITHEFEEYFEQVRLHDIKDSTFAINRTRPNDEKTEILLGCVRIRHWAFSQNASLYSYNETLDRTFLMSPCPKIKPILSWDKQDGEKIEFRSICEKKTYKICWQLDELWYKKLWIWLTKYYWLV